MLFPVLLHRGRLNLLQNNSLVLKVKADRTCPVLVYRIGTMTRIPGRGNHFLINLCRFAGGNLSERGAPIEVLAGKRMVKAVTKNQGITGFSFLNKKRAPRALRGSAASRPDNFPRLHPRSLAHSGPSQSLRCHRPAGYKPGRPPFQNRHNRDSDRETDP